MISREEAWREFVEQYEIDVPEHLVENELQYITMEMRHRMRYDTLTGGPHHLFPDAELEAQAEEIRKAAYYEAKSELVMKAILTKQNFTVTSEELEDEAIAIAERQNSTMEMVKRFFGEDLAALERGVKEQKAVTWVWERRTHCVLNKNNQRN